MSTRTLFLAWEDRQSGAMLPVGILDANDESPRYRFRYTRGAERAHREAHFLPPIDFPRLDKEYRSDSLFPLFGNRIMARGRPDRPAHLRDLDLPENAGPIDVLSANGGYRATDSYRVFPKILKGGDGTFAYRFFLRGWRDAPPPGPERVLRLKEGETLRLLPAPACSIAGTAVRVETADGQAIGWAPNCLAEDIASAERETGSCGGRVVRLNPGSAPPHDRVMIELRGRWEKHEPMSGADFRPLAG